MTSAMDERGLTAEELVLRLFEWKGKPLEKSTFEDDYRKDVDAYHEFLGKVSIKSQADKYTNFALEVRQHDSRDMEDWIQGWFEYGEADYYLFALRDDSKEGFIHTLHLIEKQKLALWVKKSKIRDTTCWFAQKLNRGRKYDLPIVKLVSIEEIKKAGLIEKTFNRRKQQ